jgi:hypothetical protein
MTLALQPRFARELAVNVMPCKSCGSENHQEFGVEMAIHSSGLKNVDKPVGSEIVVCLTCGAAQLVIQENVLRQIQKGSAVGVG